MTWKSAIATGGWAAFAQKLGTFVGMLGGNGKNWYLLHYKHSKSSESGKLD
jgi:hypothetical protein